MKTPRFKISRWIMLSLAVLTNGFLIFYSCLSGPLTSSWNAAFTTFFASIINTFTHKDVEIIPLEKIDAKLSSKETYTYNYIPGYKVEEIPLGSAKQIECSFAPDNASDKSITYIANPSEYVTLNQNGSLVSVVGMKVGECVITAKSSDGKLTSSVNVKVVDTVAPTSYEISLEKTSIAIGSTQTIKFDIDGGVLGHDELVNFRYFDTRKLTYKSTNETVATIDEYGVIYPHQVGDSTIKVSNGEFAKSIDINVTSGSEPTPYTNLHISGSNICYGNDMILDQSSKKNHHQLDIFDGETKLDPKDFIWTSSNELAAKVDYLGVLRGFRKISLDDETAKITAKSKLTGQIATFDIVIKNQLPNVMTVVLKNGDKTVYNPKEYTASVGDEMLVSLSYSPYTQTKDVKVTNSNPDVIAITNQGGTLSLRALIEGETSIIIESVINPELKLETKFTVVKAGAIDIDNIDDFGYYIRKSLGHAAVFALSQIFTLLTLYMFLYYKKWWLITLISLGEGLLVAGISEIIQYFVPSRSGRFLDVLIDFVGVLVGAGLALLGIFITKKIKSRKNKENKQ